MHNSISTQISQIHPYHRTTPTTPTIPTTPTTTSAPTHGYKWSGSRLLLALCPVQTARFMQMQEAIQMVIQAAVRGHVLTRGRQAEQPKVWSRAFKGFL